MQSFYLSSIHIDMINKLLIRPYHTADESQVIALWHQCGLVIPQNDPRKDIQRKLKVQSHLFLVGVIENKIVSSVMAGYEGHRGWVNYLAVLPEYQRNGIGLKMMEKVEILLKEMGCPKVNLQVRSNNAAVIAFYKKLGYRVEDVVSMGKRFSG